MGSTRSHSNNDNVLISVRVNANFVAGMTVGVATAVGFHPYDRFRALRSNDPSRNKRPFWAAKYWKHPFNGLRITFAQRVISNSTYFYLQSEFSRLLLPILRTRKWEEKDSKFVVGMSAGAITGAVSNASAALKTFTFKKGAGGPVENTMEMWRRGGLHPFVKGMKSSVARDSLYGATYEWTGYLLDQHVNFLFRDADQYTKDGVFFTTRLFSAAFATCVSSPFNYIRNAQLFSPPDIRQPHGLDLLSKLWTRSNRELGKNKNTHGEILTSSRLGFFRRELGIGSGTARSAIGMAVGQLLFNKTVKVLRDMDTSRPAEDISQSITPRR